MDKQKQIILMAVLGSVMLAAVACSKSDDTAPTTPTTTTSAGGPTGGPFPGGPMGGPGMGQGMGYPGAPGAMGATANAAPVPAAPVKPSGPPPPHRPDPFKVPWPSQDENPPVFSLVQPYRLATATPDVPPPPNTVVREVPSRRVSGIMSGDGVYAILEGGNSEPEIVKPGMQTSDGYRVVSITSDAVKLERKYGNYIFTQTVPLSDVPIGGPQPAGFRPRGGGIGQPGLGFPGGPGFGGRKEEE